MTRKNIATTLESLLHRNGITNGKLLETIQDYEFRKRVKLYYEGQHVVSLEKFAIQSRPDVGVDNISAFLTVCKNEDHFCYEGLAHRTTVELCGKWQDPRFLEEWIQLVPGFVDISSGGDTPSSPISSPRSGLNRRSRSPSPDPSSPRFSSPRKLSSARAPRPPSVYIGKRVCDLDICKLFDGNNLAHVMIMLTMIYQWWTQQPSMSGLREDQRPCRGGMAHCLKMALAGSKDDLSTDRAIRSCLVLLEWTNGTAFIPDCTTLIIHTLELLLYDRSAVYGASLLASLTEHLGICRKIFSVRMDGKVLDIPQ